MSTPGIFKDRLMTALHSAVQNFNQDHDPNGAVVKAARDHEFNADQTTRLVEMFNTARTLYHYKSAADRTATFSLADADTVLPELFAASAAYVAKAAEPHDYSVYGRRERNYFNQETMDKVADVPVPVEAMLSLDILANQAMKAMRDLRQMAKIAEDEARIAGHNAARTLTKLADMFSRGADETKLHDAYARLVLGHKDGEWGPVVSKLAEFTPKRHQAPEPVIRSYARTVVFDDRDLGPHLELMKEARDWMQAEAEMLAVSGQFTKEADAFEHDYLAELAPFFPVQAVESLASFVRPEIVEACKSAAAGKPAPTGLPPGKTYNIFGELVDMNPKPSDSKSPDKDSKGFTDTIGGMAGEGFKKQVGTILDTDVQRAFSEPAVRENKALSERLRNVQRQIMLQDLLTNDPVLAEEAPETVAEAYNAVLQLAPEVAGNKEVVRAILRQTVHSVAVSPYDAEMWTKLETNLRNIRGKGMAPAGPQAGGRK